MMNGASAEFSGLEHGEALSRLIQNETFEAPGVKSSLDEMGLTDVDIHEAEKKTVMELNSDGDTTTVKVKKGVQAGWKGIEVNVIVKRKCIDLKPINKS